jgi:hypothetical protein
MKAEIKKDFFSIDGLKVMVLKLIVNCFEVGGSWL